MFFRISPNSNLILVKNCKLNIFVQNYLEGLNPVQRQAVEHINGASMVIAGAGSGKTRVLTYKIVHLLKNNIPPYAILSLTFTNKAAKEMKERIAKVIGYEKTKYLWMGTFHSIFAKILRAEAEHIGFKSSFTIYDTIDSKSVLRSIIKDLNLDPKQYPANVILGRISKSKNNLITHVNYANNIGLQKEDLGSKRPETSRIFTLYAERCRKAEAMDFDDLLLYTNILLRDKPDVLKKYQEKFQFILVDEYQDTNYSQYLIIKKMSELRKNICVVGDDAQSIYAFRGAKIENIFNFKKDFPEHKLFKLEQNYRSTKNIVAAANSIIANNKKQIPKNVFSENETGAKIKVVQVKKDRAEGELITENIQNLIFENKDKYSDFAILYRTNAQSRIFEEGLRKHKIPYKIYGGTSFYQRKEIKDLLSYLQLTINTSNDEALKRVLNYPRRGIGKTTEDKVFAYANQNGISIWDTLLKINTIDIGLNSRAVNGLLGFVNMMKGFSSNMFNQNAFELAKEIASVSGILKDLYKDKTPEGISRHENIQELLNAIKDFTVNNEEDASLSKFLEDVALLTNQDNEKDDDKNKVSLMTIHSAKGLEFKNVFVVGMEDGLFPSQLSATSQKELEEERRLFYVAVTRAEKNLMISHAEMRYRWGQLNFSNPSRFIREMGGQFVEHQLAGEDDFFNQDVNDFDFNQKNSNFAKKNKFADKKVINSYSNFTEPTTPTNSRLKKVAKTPPQSSNTKDFDAKTGIKVGAKVKHQRFGVGEVLKIENDYPNTKATINFKNAGEKQLLLKFAKLELFV